MFHMPELVMPPLAAAPISQAVEDPYASGLLPDIGHAHALCAAYQWPLWAIQFAMHHISRPWLLAPLGPLAPPHPIHIGRLLGTEMLGCMSGGAGECMYAHRQQRPGMRQTHQRVATATAESSH